MLCRIDSGARSQGRPFVTRAVCSAIHPIEHEGSAEEIPNGVDLLLHEAIDLAAAHTHPVVWPSLVIPCAEFSQ